MAVSPNRATAGAFCHKKFIFHNCSLTDMCPFHGWCHHHHQLQGLEISSGWLQLEWTASQNLGRLPKEKIPLPNKGSSESPASVATRCEALALKLVWAARVGRASHTLQVIDAPGGWHYAGAGVRVV